MLCQVRVGELTGPRSRGRAVVMKFSLATLLVLLTSSAYATRPGPAWLDQLSVQGPVSTFTGPAAGAHDAFTSRIDGAQKSVLMEMFHLTDPTVIASLDRAGSRIRVDLILDGETLKKQPYSTLAETMKSAGVNVLPSSSAFTITHSKSAVFDGQTAIVSSMNLTDHPETRRDYGVVLEDPGVIIEMEKVFTQDIANAKANTGETPPLSDPHLLWSPLNSAGKLHDLVDSSETTIQAVAENFIDDGVINDLIAAAKRGVHVQVLSPACPFGTAPDRNYQAAQKLAAGGVEVRQMPDPATPTTPYQHGKMMVVDGARVYAGSINYSYNSLNKARELGIVLADAGVIAQFSKAFSDDFSHANPIGATLPACPASKMPQPTPPKPKQPKAPHKLISR